MCRVCRWRRNGQPGSSSATRRSILSLNRHYVRDRQLYELPFDRHSEPRKQAHCRECRPRRVSWQYSVHAYSSSAFGYIGPANAFAYLTYAELHVGEHGKHYDDKLQINWRFRRWCSQRNVKRGAPAAMLPSCLWARWRLFTPDGLMRSYANVGLSSANIG